MFKVIKFFNYGESFIKQIKLLYEGSLSLIQNNGNQHLYSVIVDTVTTIFIIDKAVTVLTITDYKC